ncbi:MAG: SPFH domain-containing protein [Clostridiales bacterium]|nr:SPFH domain-containing protein [Clostridiales bacterium]
MALLNVIEQEMTNEQLVVRNHIEDFNTKSQLIVYESQEALFYKNGQALDLFGPGKHTLTTENVPIIKKIFGAIFGGKTPFPCDVYFINKVNVLDIVWGTDAPIELEDPKYPMIVGVRANGQTGIRVIDSRRFAVKVVGQLQEFTVDAVRRSIKGMMLSSIKESIAAVIIEKKISILDISTRLSEIATEIQDKINAKIADLGLECDHFSVNSIMARDGDLDELRKMKAKTMALTSDADLEAYRIRTLSAARAQARATEGYTYADERRFDVLEGAAKNEGGAGGFINMGVGLGVGMGVGGEVGRMAQSAMQSNVAAQTAAADASGKVCPGCGASVAANAKFCPNCGQAQPSGPRFCPECGARVADGGKFCGECGTKLV